MLSTGDISWTELQNCMYAIAHSKSILTEEAFDLYQNAWLFEKVISQEEVKSLSTWSQAMPVGN